MTSTFPGGSVQLELDYLFPKGVDAHWFLRHSGASCYGHTYWWLIIQVAITENEPTYRHPPSKVGREHGS